MAWRKGQSGNPAGRTPTAIKYERPIRRAEKQIVDRLPWLIDKQFELAEGVTIQIEDDDGDRHIYQRPPDRQAIEYLLNRIMGKPTEREEVSGPGGGPLQTEEMGLSDSDRASRILALVQRARERAIDAAVAAMSDLDAVTGPAD